ncbi:MAG: hypothetical protein GC129_04315 [Proteobacteria bacterium]|nr:hypothetical protein [Pseudomonadota bacterium]
MSFEFVHVLVIAYAVMGGVALVGYLPQMMAFWRNPMLCQEAPLMTWVMWTLQTIVFNLYALFVNKDVMYIATTTAFMLATIACTGLQIYGRWYAKKHDLHGRRATVIPFTGAPDPGSPLKPKPVGGEKKAA